MRDSRFVDRCFVAVVLLALLALFSAVAYSLADPEPRMTRTTLLLQSHK